MRWSFSRVSCFDHCKYEFYLQYIVKDDELYPQMDNYYAQVGSFVHEILAMIFTGKLDKEDALDYYINHFDESVDQSTKPSIMAKTYCAIADYFANLELDWLDQYEVVFVEQEVRFTFEGEDFIGFVDLLLRDKKDGKYVLMDHKSSDYPFGKNGKVKKSSQNSFENYKRQMYLYAHAIRNVVGEYPKELAWNHFKAGGKLAVIPFDMDDYLSSMDWFRKQLYAYEKEEAFEPATDYFYCNHLCNFRNCCEYVNLTGVENVS